jgi:hypothetical protein
LIKGKEPSIKVRSESPLPEKTNQQKTIPVNSNHGHHFDIFIDLITVKRCLSENSHDKLNSKLSIW